MRNLFGSERRDYEDLKSFAAGLEALDPEYEAARYSEPEWEQWEGPASSSPVFAPTAGELYEFFTPYAQTAQVKRGAAPRRTTARSKKLPDATLKGFDKNSAKLKASHAPEIDKMADQVVASWRTGPPIVTIYVVGHTSSEGSAQYNIGLGRGRALTVIKALKKALEAKQRNLSYKVLILANTKGEKEPIDTNETEQGRVQNRRVEVFLSTTALAPIRPKIRPNQKERPLICPPTNRPHICVDPRTFRYTTTERIGGRFSDVFLIQNAAPSSVNWAIEVEKQGKFAKVPWISVTPRAGIFGEAPQKISLFVDAKGLPVGQYSAIIKITASGADNSPQNVVVNLEVKPAIGIGPAPKTLVATGIWRTGPVPQLVTATSIMDMQFELRNIGSMPAQVSITANTGETKKSLLSGGGNASLKFQNPRISNWQFWVNASAGLGSPKPGGGTQITWALYSL